MSLADAPPYVQETMADCGWVAVAPATFPAPRPFLLRA